MGCTASASLLYRREVFTAISPLNSDPYLITLGGAVQTFRDIDTRSKSIQSL